MLLLEHLGGLSLILAFIVRGAIGTIFLLSGSSKLRDPFPTSLAIKRFGVTGEIRPRLGAVVAVVEIGLGACLFVVSWRAVPAALSAGLLAVFCFLIARSLARGERFSCGCFGSQSEVLSAVTLIRAVLMLGLVVIALAIELGGPGDLTIIERWDGIIAGSLAVAALLLLDGLRSTRPFSYRLEGDGG
jgi:uncharacterized membrane protein YphA (DoxX/SURF4 family)